MVIYKYEVKPEVSMPPGAEILSVQIQGRVPTIWALVDPARSTHEVRHFRVLGTGEHVATHPGKWLATLQDGCLVWHVFEVMT
jgi:hypothetical protein